MLTTLLTLLGSQQIALSTTFPAAENTINLPAAAYPILKPLAIKPILKATAAFSIDLETGQILFDQNGNEHLAMASLTKLMTAWIILHEHQMDDVVKISLEATKVEPAKANLLAYEKITVKNLLKAVLIKSANDAALALAIYDSGSEEKFAEKMNRYASELGLQNTHFTNSTGFDAENHYSSAKDLALLARKIFQNKFVSTVAGIKSTEISSTDNKFTHQLETTNSLFDSYLKVLGLKTGTTDNAGPCLISIVEQNDHRILTVMLNSPDRYNESKLLSQWIFDNYYW